MGPAIVLFLNILILGQVIPLSQGEVHLDADELLHEDSTGIYTARGHVRIRQGRVTVTADEVRFDPGTQDVAAAGHVEVNDGEETLRAEKLVLNLRTQTGAMMNGEIIVARDKSHIRADKIEKTGERTFRVSHGTLTTCECGGGKPSWALFADDVKLTLGKYAVSRDFLFHIKGVPVFYLPYMISPIKTDQESGLLAPRYVYSLRDGSEFFLPYYLAIAPWMDATATPEYFTSRGAGADGEIRYSLTHDSGGRVAARYFEDFLGGSGRGRWEVSFRHGDRWDWAEGSWGKADVHLYGDPAYQADFGEVLETSSQQYTESRASFGVFSWPVHLIPEIIYYQDIYSSAGLTSFTPTTLQRIPRISLTAFPYRIPRTPVYYDGLLVFDNFRSEERNAGQRLFWSPTLSLPVNIHDIVQIVPQIEMISRGYLTDTTTQSSFIPQASLFLSTKLYRPFGALKHVVEPEVSYRYVPSQAQDSLPLFDERDRISPKRETAVSLKNFFVYRSSDGSSREAAQVLLRAAYDAEGRRYGGRGEVVVKPQSWLYWKIVGEGGLSGEGITNITNILDVHDERSNRAFLSYAYLPGPAPVDEVNGGVGLNIVGRLLPSFTAQYSFAQKAMLQMVTGLRYNSGCKCWSLDLTWIHRPQTWMRDDRIMVLLTLTGLGSVGY